MQRKIRAVGALCAALALAAAAACTDDAGGGDGSGPEGAGEVFEEDRLVDMVNESNRLLYDLENAEFRIIQNCLVREGFTVHDQMWFTAYEPVEQEALFGAEDWGSWLPEVDEAAEYGLGTWATTEDGQSDPALDAYYEHKGIVVDGAPEGDAGGESPSGGGLSDNGEFEALAPEEQYDWYVAYWGEATAAVENAYLLGEDRPDSADGGATDGEIDLGGEFDYVQTEPGGCQREMIDALYDDLQLIEDPEGGEYRSANWSWRPLNPMDDFSATEEFDLRYREQRADVEVALVDCLEERGHPGWEFDEEGSLPLSDYFYELYEGTADVHDHPDLPDDAPADYEGKKEFEIAFAVELAECGDETGFRDTATQAWADSQNAYYLSIETSVYAWQEEIRTILATAQEAIEG